MPGSSTGDTAFRPSLGERLRQVTWTRVAFMVALIAIGLVITRVLDRGGARISEGRAVAIARPQVDFTPEGHNIRLVRRGVPPRPFWAVSFWIKNSSGTTTRVTLVLVNADTGQVTEVRKGT
ncbi:MAG TPA: hypothetical protein VE693_00655 [Gaiellaceae bacterium]|nr:hypothetical protein [Gaiellaceae bacterium]